MRETEHAGQEASTEEEGEKKQPNAQPFKEPLQRGQTNVIVINDTIDGAVCEVIGGVVKSDVNFSINECKITCRDRSKQTNPKKELNAINFMRMKNILRKYSYFESIFSVDS